MAELARVLRPGGHLVISDIHVLSLYLGVVATAAGPRSQVPGTVLGMGSSLRRRISP